MCLNLKHSFFSMYNHSYFYVFYLQECILKSKHGPNEGVIQYVVSEIEMDVQQFWKGFILCQPDQHSLCLHLFKKPEKQLCLWTIVWDYCFVIILFAIVLVSISNIMK